MENDRRGLYKEVRVGLNGEIRTKTGPAGGRDIAFGPSQVEIGEVITLHGLPHQRIPNEPYYDKMMDEEQKEKTS